MINGYISIGVIYAKIFRDLGLNEELDTNSIIEWCAEALAYIGAFGQYIPKFLSLSIENHKAKLPCDFYKLIEIRYKGVPMSWNGKNTHSYLCDGNTIPKCCTDFSFAIENNHIITSEETIDKDDITGSYLSIPTDEDGLPMIPDNQYYLQAVTSYVTSKLDYREWRKGRIPDKVFQKSEADWQFYCAAARGSANLPNLQQLESYKNILLRPFQGRNFVQDMENLGNPFAKYVI